MELKEALTLAIKILKVRHNYMLFASDSELSDKRRAQIAEAIEVLEKEMDDGRPTMA
jgi:hypothetical protein